MMFKYNNSCAFQIDVFYFNNRLHFSLFIPFIIMMMTRIKTIESMKMVVYFQLKLFKNYRLVLFNKPIYFKQLIFGKLRWVLKNKPIYVVYHNGDMQFKYIYEYKTFLGIPFKRFYKGWALFNDRGGLCYKYPNKEIDNSNRYDALNEYDEFIKNIHSSLSKIINKLKPFISDE